MRSHFCLRVRCVSMAYVNDEGLNIQLAKSYLSNYASYFSTNFLNISVPKRENRTCVRSFPSGLITCARIFAMERERKIMNSFKFFTEQLSKRVVGGRSQRACWFPNWNSVAWPTKIPRREPFIKVVPLWLSQPERLTGFLIKEMIQKRRESIVSTVTDELEWSFDIRDRANLGTFPDLETKCGAKRSLVGIKGKLWHDARVEMSVFIYGG